MTDDALWDRIKVLYDNKNVPLDDDQKVEILEKARKHPLYPDKNAMLSAIESALDSILPYSEVRPVNGGTSWEFTTPTGGFVCETKATASKYAAREFQK